ncbi:MAG: hypothetical protein FWD47_00490 [Treponema sp.]|nr:hypothetical protein [Treponema sp.]
MSKKVLIITDGKKSIRSIALAISQSLSGYKIKIIPSKRFCTTMLLPVDTFFIGCERHSPKSFSYIEKMLSHINLASRKCGIFSVNEKAAQYLAKILNTCDAAVSPPFLAEKNDNETVIDNANLKKWLKNITEN